MDGDPIESANLRVVLIEKMVATNRWLNFQNELKSLMEIRGLISEALSMQQDIF